nr:Uncharacterised protein [Klebsiella pneumoniae]
MDHAIKLLCGEQLCHTFTVGQIQLLEMECRRSQRSRRACFRLTS